jgi:hypothetical protein
MFVLMASVFGLAACAEERQFPSAGAIDGLRVLVRLAPPATSGGAPNERPPSIERRAAASSGVPVHYLAASGSQWHALMLLCSPADCDAALQRLAADHANFSTVQRDELRRR